MNNPAGQAFISVDAHESGVQHLEFQPPAGKPIGMFQRQIEVVDGDAGDFHALIAGGSASPSPRQTIKANKG